MGVGVSRGAHGEPDEGLIELGEGLESSGRRARSPASELGGDDDEDVVARPAACGSSRRSREPRRSPWTRLQGDRWTVAVATASGGDG